MITKLPQTGGMVTRATCAEQMLYEIHDPARYYQPDVIADFSQVTLEEIGRDRVAVRNASGHAATGSLKVSVGYRDGWLGEGQISYAGSNCVGRGELAGAILRERVLDARNSILEDRVDLIGLNSITAGRVNTIVPSEIRLRYAARCSDRETAARIGEEVEGLYLNGPAGGGGVFSSVREIIGIASTLLEAAKVTPSTEFMEIPHEVA